jgi:DNA polymerase-3 subunit delta
MAACDTVPFMSAARLVIVEGLLSRLGGTRSGGRGRKGGGAQTGGRPSEADAWLALAEHVDAMPPTTHLVLTDGEVGAGNPLLVALKGKGEVREFRPLGQRAVVPWIERRARAIDLKLEPGAVKLLAEFVGDDLWALAGELDKLSLYANGETVSGDDVRALVAAVRETSVFPLVDAIVEGRPAAAVRLLRQMFRQEASAQYILAMVQRQVRLLAVARDMLDGGASGRAIGEALRLRDFALERLLDQAPRYSAGRVRAAFRRLLEADLQIKRGVYGAELALELLVQDLAEKRPSGRAA